MTGADEKIRDRISRLSPGQKQCLSLVFKHNSSKEIARLLKISRHTVDQRIARACQTLGLPNRRDAALTFAKYDPFVYEPSDIAMSNDFGSPPKSEEASREQGPQLLETMAADNFEPTESDRSSSTLALLPIPLSPGERNDLALVYRLGWTFAIFVLATITSGVLIAALEALGRLI
jgi:DNA-binding CsgD family transcriptional regulator